MNPLHALTLLAGLVAGLVIGIVIGALIGSALGLGISRTIDAYDRYRHDPHPVNDRTIQRALEHQPRLAHQINHQNLALSATRTHPLTSTTPTA